MTGFFRRFCAVLLVVALIIVLGAQSADAHSQIDSSDPANGEMLKTSPKSISLSFSEDVDVTPNSIRLFNDRGKQVNINDSASAANGEVRISVPTLEKGTYVVAWNVISADTHPVKGSFIFSVDSKLNNKFAIDNDFDKYFANSGDNQFLKIGFTISRFLIFTSLAVLVALMFFRIFILQGELTRKLNSLFLISALVCVASSVAAFAFYFSIAREVGLAGVFNIGAFPQEFSFRFGTVTLLRLGSLLGLSVVWKYWRRPSPIFGFVFSVLLVSSLVFAGHAVVGTHTYLALLSDFAHLYSASIWFGGLIIIPFVIKGKNGLQIVRKFSKVALCCVVVIAITGVFAWWRQIGSIDAAMTTWFGQLVNFKTLFFVGTICVAFFTRNHLRASSEKNDSPERTSKLLKLVYIESVLLVFVMVASALLVNSIPARTALSVPVSKQVSVSTGYLEITVDPPRVGSNQVHVYMLNKNGTPYPAIETGASLTNDVIKATWSNKDKEVSPIPVTMKFQGLNHFISLNSNVPFPGKWTLKVRIQISDFDVVEASIDVNIR